MSAALTECWQCGSPMGSTKDWLNERGMCPHCEPRVVKLAAVPDPMSDAFAVTDAERAGHPINQTAWRRSGAWSFREFGEEAQLRNPALPWLSMDLTRAEVEDLHDALADILSRPMALPYRLTWWDRAKQWWLRSVWRRRHYAEVDAAQKALVAEYTRKGPWG